MTCNYTLVCDTTGPSRLAIHSFARAQRRRARSRTSTRRRRPADRHFSWSPNGGASRGKRVCSTWKWYRLPSLKSNAIKHEKHRRRDAKRMADRRVLFVRSCACSPARCLPQGERSQFVLWMHLHHGESYFVKIMLEVEVQNLRLNTRWWYLDGRSKGYVNRLRVK